MGLFDKSEELGNNHVGWLGRAADDLTFGKPASRVRCGDYSEAGGPWAAANAKKTGEIDPISFILDKKK